MIDHCAFTQNNGVGLAVSDYWQVTLNQIHCSANGARGAGFQQMFNAVVQDSQFNGNNWREYPSYIGWDAGGIKSFDGGYGSPANLTNLTQNLKFLRCAINDNLAPGLWTDYSGTNIIVDSCLLQNNLHGGLDFEMTPGPLLVTNTVVRSNGYANVFSYGSPYATFVNSYVYGTQTEPAAGVTDPSSVAEFVITADDRTNPSFNQFAHLPNAYGQCQGWKFQSCVIAATWATNYNGLTNDGVPLFNGDSGTGVNPNRPVKLSFVNSVSSDSNQWWRAYGGKDYNGTSYTSSQAFLSLVASPGTGDQIFSQWTNQVNTLGHHDVHSKWGAPNLANVADPTLLNLPTTTGLTSSLNPAANGSNVTFTATVQTNGVTAAAATGTVTFYNGSVAIGTAMVAGGVATLTTNGLAAGVLGISAVYIGDNNYGGSTAVTLAQTVNAINCIATTVALGSSQNPSTNGNPVTLTATVKTNGVTAAGVTGTVVFYDGSTAISTNGLVSGVATLTASTLTIGTHSISAVYAGDPNYAGSSSATLNQVLNPLPVNAQLAAYDQFNGSALTNGGSGWTAAWNSGGYMTSAANLNYINLATGGSAAAITAESGTTPAQPYRVMANPPTNGVVWFSWLMKITGAQEVRMDFYKGSTKQFIIGKAYSDTGTINILDLNANPMVDSRQVITGTNFVVVSLNTANGQVDLYVNPTNLASGTAPLGWVEHETYTFSAMTVDTLHPCNGFSASGGLTVDELRVGTNRLTVSPVTNTVSSPATTATVIGSSLNPSTYGSSVTFTATVRTNSATAANATGTVVFDDGTTPLATNSVTSGVATFSTSSLTAGSHAITAAYSGDANHAGSTSSSTNQTVGKATPGITTAPSASAIFFGQTLASSTLSGGTASTAGIFAFTTPTIAPNAGTTNVNVTFNPTDTANYANATNTVTVMVNAPPVPNLTGASLIFGGSKLQISGTGVAGLGYTLRGTNNLVAPAPWPPVTNTTANGIGAFQFNMPMTSNVVQFYKVTTP